MTEAAIERLLSFAHVRLGMRTRGTTPAELSRRLARIVRRSGAGDAAEALLGLGAADPGGALYRIALDELTIGETWLFRDRRLFQLLEEELLPKLASSGEQLRIWSAGCGSGEEAYSLAWTARQVHHGPVVVVATDVHPDRLEHARGGVYDRRAARGHELPPSFADEDASGRLAPRGLRDTALRFDLHNLALDPPPQLGWFHLVVCRNVLLYFHDDAARAALDSFAASLAPGGRLVLGPSDVIERPKIVPATLEVERPAPAVFRLRSPAGKTETTPSTPAEPVAVARRPAEAIPAAKASPRAERRGAPAKVPLSEDARYLALLAEARLAAKDLAGAEEACLRALDLAPGDRHAAQVLVSLALERGEPKLARALERTIEEARGDGGPPPARPRPGSGERT